MSERYQALSNLIKEHNRFEEENGKLIIENANIKEDNRRLKEYNDQLEQRLADAGLEIMKLRLVDEALASCKQQGCPAFKELYTKLSTNPSPTSS